MSESPSTRRSTQTGVTSPRKKSCEECRRLKLRCSREWPCSECVRRGTASLCPTGTSSRGISKSAQILLLQGRIAELEASLKRYSAPALNSNTYFAPPPRSSGMTALSPSSPTSPFSALSSQFSTRAVDSVGQLTWKKGGNTRFFGMTAADHRLAVVDDSEASNSPETFTMAAPLDAVLADVDSEWPLVTISPDPRTEALSNLMACLPSRQHAMRLVQVYWDFTSWRFEPFTKQFFDDIFEEIYPSQHGVAPPHPHRLALGFAVFALAALFYPAAETRTSAGRYHRYTKVALTLGNFLNEVSVASLSTIHLVCGYVLNAEVGMDELYVLVGLGLRLATTAGYHRDGSWWNITQPDLDHRRRVWWELTQLERVHSLSFGLPSTLPAGCDTAKPSTLNPMSFFWWKWELQVLVSQSVEAIAVTGHRSYDAILAADQSLRAYDAKLPDHLRCRAVPLWRLTPSIQQDPASRSQKDYIEVPGLGDDGMPLQLRLQQIRLAQLYNHSLLHLHRSSFTSSLQTEPSEGPFAPSVLAVVVESSSNSINLIGALYRMDSNVPHYFAASNVLDLYNGLACLATILIRRPSSPLRDHCVKQLELGMELMNQIQADSRSARAGRLFDNIKKLADEAMVCVRGLETVDQEVFFPVAGAKSRSEMDIQGSQAELHGMVSMSDVDFDAWLSQFLSAGQAA